MTRQVSGGAARAAGSGLYHHVKHQPARPGKRRHLLAGLAFAALVFPLTSTHGSAAEQNFPANGSWAVPAGVSIVQVFIAGGSGGDGGRNTDGTGPALGGAGLAITAGLNVTAGETVYIGLGANGQDNSTNPAVAAASAFGIGPGGKYTYSSAQGAGGGGGGASAIAVNDDIVVIAGGGGGAGGFREMDGFPIPSSGVGGQGGGARGDAASWWAISSTRGDGGAGGSIANGAASILSRTGGGGGGGASAADTGFNVGGGGGGAGFYGGREGNGGGGSLAQSSGGGGGGGASYASPARIPQDTNAYVPAASSTSPSGRIDYINITTTALADATTSVAYTATLTASFGAAGTPDQWAVSPALPTGIVLDPDTGVVSGTATTASTGTYTFTATEFAGGELAARSSVNLNLTVVDPPTPTPTPEPTGIASPGAVSDSGSTQPSILAPDLSAVAPGHFTFDRNTPSEVLVAVNRGGSAEFSVDPVLPDGLTLDRSAGILRGTPTSVQEKTEYTITAVNTRGRSSTQITVRVSGSAPASAATLQPSSVRFAARSQKLTRGMKAALSVWHAERPGQALALTGVIPRSGNGFSLARQRAMKVRQFLKKRGAEVSPIIRITRANAPPMTRRVLLAP